MINFSYIWFHIQQRLEIRWIRRILRHYEFVPQYPDSKNEFSGSLSSSRFLKQMLIRSGYILQVGHTKDQLDIDSLVNRKLNIAIDLWYMNGSVEAFIDVQ
jgi:hypothetical protein